MRRGPRDHVRCNGPRVRGLEKDTFTVAGRRGGGNTCRDIMRNYRGARLAAGRGEGDGAAECGRRHKMSLISLKKRLFISGAPRLTYPDDPIPRACPSRAVMLTSEISA